MRCSTEEIGKLISIAKGKLSKGQDAEEFVQDLLLQIWKREKVTNGEEKGFGYLIKALQHKIDGTERQNRRNLKTPQFISPKKLNNDWNTELARLDRDHLLFGSGEKFSAQESIAFSAQETSLKEPELWHHAEIVKYVQDLKPHEQELINTRLKQRSYGQSGTWRELSKGDRKEEARLRQNYRRALAKAESRMVLNWFKDGRYKEINNYRLSEGFLKQVAKLARKQKLPPEFFFEAFRNKEMSPCIQNATWVLMHMGGKNPSARKFLETKIHDQNLFRGNLHYLMESLLLLNSDQYAETHRDFLNRMYDMNARISPPTQLPTHEQAPFNKRCLMDVIPYKPIGKGVSDSELRQIRNNYLSGKFDEDLHRTLAWQLLRTNPKESGNLKILIGALKEDLDQVNVYYIVRFIMGFGLKLFPQELLQTDTYRALRAVSFRWPQNAYFRESSARVAMALKKHRR